MTTNDGGCLEATVEERVIPSSYLDEGQLAVVLEADQGIEGHQETAIEITGTLGRCWSI